MSEIEPGASGAAAGPAPSGTWPAQVRIAFWLFLALIAIRLVLVPFAIVREWTSAYAVLAADQGAYSAAVTDKALAVTHGATIPADVILVALYALCVLAAVRLRRGAGWARIVLTVLGAVSIVTAAVSGGSPTGLVIGLVGAGGTVLLWLGPSNAWFRAGKAARIAEAQRRAEAGAEV